jgi:hypothetical protein
MKMCIFTDESLDEDCQCIQVRATNTTAEGSCHLSSDLPTFNYDVACSNNGDRLQPS